MNTIQINPADNVIVALSPLAKGAAVEVPGVGEVVAAEDIPQVTRWPCAPLQPVRMSSSTVFPSAT